MTRPLVVGFVLLSAFAHATTVSAQNDAVAFNGTIKPFLEAHCTTCHGPDTQKAGLRLDQLKADFADASTASQWIKVLDKVHAGDMPPRNRKRPDAKETAAVTQWLHATLREVSLQMQLKQGRVVLRRLNRTEYETTLRDLLDPSIEVKDLLPEDSSAAGFDNVSAVLDVSSVHLLRYQEAADRALRAAIPTRPAVPSAKLRRSGREVTEKMAFFKDLLGKVVRVDGDTLLLYVRPYGHVPCATPPASVAGRYRVRASVYAVQTDGKPIPLLMTCRDVYGRDDHDVRAVRDIPEGKATVIEEEVTLKARENIVFQGWTLPALRELTMLGKGGLAQYKGPGLAVEWVEIEGPLDSWPPAGYQRLFGDLPFKPKSVAKLEAEGKPTPPEPVKRPDQWWIYDPLTVAPKDAKKDADRLMRAFLPVAFRRPVEEKLQSYYVKIVHDALDMKLSFQEAMLMGYKAALCSPHFLYLIEGVDFGKSTTLDNYALASRLSYFLWSSMPDRRLIDLAEKGELTKHAMLRDQVERLLKDPKAKRFTANFAGQWLDLRLINATSPDPQIFIEYDPFLYWSMPRETEAFFEHILRQDRSLVEFVHSDWSFLNQRLAQHYGIPLLPSPPGRGAGGEVLYGGELRKVKLPPESHRGGVITHASVLKVTADGTRTSPILRGKWVLERILGQAPSPPPPGTPAIDPDIRGATTIRQQLDKHRNTPACASCHRHIDPPGFALENFDAIGGWRDFYRVPRPIRPGERQIDLANYPGKKIFRGLEVEKGGELPDGRAFKNIDEYKQLLMTDKDQLARNLAQKLLIYATGADIQFADREVVEQLVARSREQKYGFRSLIHEVVQSRVFLSK